MYIRITVKLLCKMEYLTVHKANAKIYLVFGLCELIETLPFSNQVSGRNCNGLNLNKKYPIKFQKYFYFT